MGLAEELRPGVWKVAERTEQVLRDLGQRGDIMKTMQRALKDAGIDRGAADYSVFDAGRPDQKITGKIVGIGLSNELHDQHYVVVDGTDGKLHYAEIGRLSRYDPPSKDGVVTLRSHDTSNLQSQARLPVARLFVESHLPFHELASADGATWLDRKLLSKEPLEFRNKGFGAQANQALRLRQQWLIKEELMTEQAGQLVARRRMLAELTKRDVAKAGTDLAKKLTLSHVSLSELSTHNVDISRSVRLASGRFTIMQKGKQFALVPWKEAMQLRKGKGIGMEVGKSISR